MGNPGEQPRPITSAYSVLEILERTRSCTLLQKEMASYLNQLEYEEQLYGFNQETVLNFVKDVIVDFLEQGLESLSRKLVPQYGEEAINEFVTNILEAYRTALLNRSNELKNIVNDYFAISPNLVLPDDQIHDELPDDEEARLDRQIEAEKRKFMALSVMERNMKNVLQNVMREDEGIATALSLSTAAGQLLQNSQAFVSSLGTLESNLDLIFRNMNLN